MVVGLLVGVASEACDTRHKRNRPRGRCGATAWGCSRRFPTFPRPWPPSAPSFTKRSGPRPHPRPCPQSFAPLSPRSPRCISRRAALGPSVGRQVASVRDVMGQRLAAKDEEIAVLSARLDAKDGEIAALQQSAGRGERGFHHFPPLTRAPPATPSTSAAPPPLHSTPRRPRARAMRWARCRPLSTPGPPPSPARSPPTRPLAKRAVTPSTSLSTRGVRRSPTGRATRTP